MKYVVALFLLWVTSVYLRSLYELAWFIGVVIAGTTMFLAGYTFCEERKRR